MIFAENSIIPSNCFCTLDYLDSKYQGWIQRDPQTKKILKQGPGILWLDENHCIISQWKNDEINTNNNIIITSHGGILDISGQAHSKIKYVDTLQGYIIIGDFQTEEWRIESIRDLDKAAEMTIKQNEHDQKYLDSFKEVKKQKSNIMAEEYEKFAEKAKKILLQEHQSGFEFKVIESENLMTRKQKKINFLVTSTCPEKIQIKLEGKREQNSGETQNSLQTYFSLKFIQFLNSYSVPQLSFKLQNQISCFSDKTKIKCEQIVLEYKHQYNMGEKEQREKQEQQIQKAKKYAGQKEKKPSRRNGKYYFQYIKQIQKSEHSEHMTKKKKIHYHMKNMQYLNVSHIGLSKSITTITSYIRDVIALYQIQCMKNWSGKNKKTEDAGQIKANNEENNNEIFEATHDDLVQELLKIKKGDYKSPKKGKLSQSRTNSNLNKTFFDHKTSKKPFNYENIGNMTHIHPKIQKAKQKNEINLNAAIGEYLFLQEMIMKDEKKIDKAFSRLKEVQQKQREVQRQKKQVKTPKRAVEVEQIDRKQERSNPQNLNKLADDYNIIKRQLGQEFHKNGVTYPQKNYRKRQQVWERNYKVALQRMQRRADR